MIEPEMAFCDLQGDMDLGEEFIKAMARYALEHCAEDLAFFAKFVDKGLQRAAASSSSSGRSCACPTPRRSRF